MPSLSDAFRAHPVHLQQKHLDFDSLQEVPDSYAWTQADEHPSVDSFALETVPIIDLNDINAPQLIGHACRTWGVFQIINHGIPTSLLDKVEWTGKSLFSLPTQQKLKAARSPDGVSGYGVARISSFFPKLMWSEGFTIVCSPVEQFRLLWPQDYSRYLYDESILMHVEAIVEYGKEVSQLAGRLFWLMLASLGIVKEDIKWGGTNGDLKGSCAALQLNSYPVCPDPDKAMGLAAHTDSALLTILHQNSISGLQVLQEGKGWVTVPPVQGGLVVNLGDLLHILSNGLYRTVLHRVVVNRFQPRFSIAYLFGPPESVKISPHPKSVGPTCPPLYRSVTWNEYLGTKAKHFNEALTSVRLCVPLSGLFDVNENNSSVQVG